ncbi:MAG: phosphate propanoyltransferase [Massilioclostridium sp.]|nr:phosphate propanoyltransferase [Massilioclostridium sp.]MEE1492746.1 phosphate propanoyltransferase [Massilioclostridium sp.]
MMNVNPAVVAEIVKQVIAESGLAVAQPSGGIKPVPVGISNRHIHLSREDLNTLFGEGYELNQLKDLSQPGQYACKECVTIIGPSLKPIEKVRVLGPLRKQTQIEISRTDSFLLKVKPPVRESGSLVGSAPIMVVGPKGVISLSEGCIIANRHIHMSPADGAAYGVADGEYVDVEVGGERRTKFYDVQVRVNKAFSLEMHVDTDDANAAGLKNGDTVTVVTKK